MIGKNTMFRQNCQKFLDAVKQESAVVEGFRNTCITKGGRGVHMSYINEDDYNGFWTISSIYPYSRQITYSFIFMDAVRTKNLVSPLASVYGEDALAIINEVDTYDTSNTLLFLFVKNPDEVHLLNITIPVNPNNTASIAPIAAHLREYQGNIQQPQTNNNTNTNTTIDDAQEGYNNAEEDGQNDDDYGSNDEVWEDEDSF